MNSPFNRQRVSSQTTANYSHKSMERDLRSSEMTEHVMEKGHYSQTEQVGINPVYVQQV